MGKDAILGDSDRALAVCLPALAWASPQSGGHLLRSDSAGSPGSNSLPKFCHPGQDSFRDTDEGSLYRLLHLVVSDTEGKVSGLESQLGPSLSTAS